MSTERGDVTKAGVQIPRYSVLAPFLVRTCLPKYTVMDQNPANGASPGVNDIIIADIREISKHPKARILFVFAIEN